MTDIIGGAPGASDDLVKDATIETFQADVLQASLEVPVVVDFWAAWCGPCRQLGPVLEKQVKARGGKVRMVKVDTDKNQMLAQQLRIQSLPTVMAFIGGQPVDGFQGALPESQVSQFLDRIVDAAAQSGLGGKAPGGQDPKALIEAGEEALQNGDIASAMQAFAIAADGAEEDSDERAMALAGMARCALQAGDKDKAQQILAMVPQGKSGLPAVAQVDAMMSLTGGNADQGAVADARSLAEANPEDPSALFTLGEALVESGEMEEAMAVLLKSIEQDQEWNEGAAKAKLLTVFEALGATHPAVKTGRRRLSSILFA